jgi:hypothetical protein
MVSWVVDDRDGGGEYAILESDEEGGETPLEKEEEVLMFGLMSFLVLLGMSGFFALAGLAIWAVWTGATVLSWGTFVVPIGSGLIGWYITQITGLYNWLLEGVYGYSTGAVMFMIGIVCFAVVLVGNVGSTLGKKTITAVR